MRIRRCGFLDIILGQGSRLYYDLRFLSRVIFNTRETSEISFVDKNVFGERGVDIQTVAARTRYGRFVCAGPPIPH